MRPGDRPVSASGEWDEPNSAPAKIAAGAMSSARREALDRLFQRHWNEIVAYVARAFGKGPPDPEDAAQSAFAQYAALEEPERIVNPRAFLYRSAGNYVLDFKRRAKTRARFEASAEAEILMGGSNELTPERVLSAKERAEILEKAVLSLKPRHREALLLNRLHGMSYAQIARAKGVSETEARRLVAMAVRICDQALLAAESERAPAARKAKTTR